MTSMDVFFGQSPLTRGAAGKKLSDPLPQLLAQIATRIGPDVLFTRTTTRPWASALFEGRRHVVVLSLAGVDARKRIDAFLDGLGEVEWSLTGHFVADICKDDCQESDGGITLHLSALTIEDW